MIYKVPEFLKKLYPTLIWNIETKEKTIYITFDDGPSPVITDWVLEVLNQYNAKATFFCIGDKVRKYPETYQKILSKGHAVGNHTFNHLNGWKTNDFNYIENTMKCKELVSSNLFRPPYGRIKKSQITGLSEEYKIIMWSMLSWDFLKNLDQKYCMKVLSEKTKKGDIVVFHDSEKSEHNLRYLLPEFLKFFSNKEYKFESLPLERF